MAFHLKPDEPFAAGLRRVARQEMRAAAKQLRRDKSLTEGVHAARKGIKRVRAIVGLVDDIVDAGHANKKLRQAGRALSPIRDADAVIASATHLQDDIGGAVSPAQYAVLGDRLRRRRRKSMAKARRDQPQDVARRVLEKLRRSVGSWDWDEVTLPALLTALRRAYAEARRGFRAAEKDPSADAFHDWRKQVKTLWYALRVLDPRFRELGPRLAELRQLQDWLGEDHDLEVLCSSLPRRHAHDLTVAAGHVRTVASQRQATLRTRALKAGRTIFATTPAEFVTELRKKSLHLAA